MWQKLIAKYGLVIFKVEFLYGLTQWRWSRCFENYNYTEKRGDVVFVDRGFGDYCLRTRAFGTGFNNAVDILTASGGGIW